MKILILVVYYAPSVESGATLIHDLGVEFRRQGHKVTILTPSDKVSKPFEITIEDGLRVVRVKTKQIKGTTKFLRAFREVRLSSSLWRLAKPFLLANKSDLIIFYSPTIFFSGLVRRLKKLWGCPAYLILRDIFPQWVVDAGILRKGSVWRFFRKKEIEQYEVADLIGVQSPANLEYFSENFPEKRQRLQVLYNWASLDRRDLLSTGYRERLGLKEKVVFLYGGNLGVAQDLENIIRLAVRFTPHRHVHFLLVGDGSETSKLERIISERELSNIQILPPLPEREYMSMLAEADVGLISLDRRLKTHNLPGKLLGYMYCGKPLLSSINPGNDLLDLIENYQVGFCHVNGEDEKLFASAMKLANDAALRARMGNNSRQLLERLFSAEKAVQQILRQFEKREALVGESALTERSSSLPHEARL